MNAGDKKDYSGEKKENSGEKRILVKRWPDDVGAGGRGGGSGSLWDSGGGILVQRQEDGRLYFQVVSIVDN